MILIDFTTTSHNRAQTGVQRVCRSLYSSLSKVRDVIPVCFDPYLSRWRELDEAELANIELAADCKPGNKRSAHWSLRSRLRGYLGRRGGWAKELYQEKYDALIVPEVFVEMTGKRFGELFALVEGPKVALCHDLFSILLPQFSSAHTLVYFPRYLDALGAFDGIAANSQSTQDDLELYWKECGMSPLAKVEAIPLGLKFKVFDQEETKYTRDSKKILCVGTFEGRKNQLQLLKAAESLWKNGKVFELRFVGGINHSTGKVAVNYLEELVKKDYPVTWSGNLSDAALAGAYQTSDFTVYPSLAEGFGLPVMESLSFGKPCICGEGGALKEVLQGGGCVSVDVNSPEAIASAIKVLLTDSDRLAELKIEAKSRQFPTWDDYTERLLAWMDSF
ncbi:MAG: glycosyl transferase family 1 [Opitutaceae bacterium]|nr:glycosyl transferase family 1 [Opitutaceae bacterium]